MPPNQRLQLALQRFVAPPLFDVDLGLITDGRDLLIAFVPMTPALLRGAAETHVR